MTGHIAMNEIAAGRASLDEIIIPPAESWGINQPRYSSLMGLAPGQSLTLRELLLGQATFSGNDASTAIALRFAPTEAAFIEMMNREAIAMGLTRTRFADASGFSNHNMTTAREMAEFSRRYITAHPEALRYFHSVMEHAYPLSEHVAPPFRANPGTRVQRNRNTLLGRVQGVDGIKTGFIPESGFNISLTAERDGTRFIAVVMGSPSGLGGDRIRDEDGEALLEWAFERFQTIRFNPGTLAPARIWRGRDNYVSIAVNAPLYFTTLTERGALLSWRIQYENPLLAPLPAGSHAGILVLYDTLGDLRHIPLVTTSDVESGGFFKRLVDNIRLFFQRHFG
jgi:D-alanyl-D-alanine carboxypeptidase (penicillin-binding protein 5/6)